MTQSEIERNYKYHKPNERQALSLELIREKSQELAELINKECPGSREQSIAFTSLEEVKMWACAAIVRYE